MDGMKIKVKKTPDRNIENGDLVTIGTDPTIYQACNAFDSKGGVRGVELKVYSRPVNK
jgi:hypothetical protein